MGFLGKLLADVSYLLDPELFILGGGLSGAGDYLLEVVERHYRRYPKLTGDRARFALARLGSAAGMYGAARLACDDVHQP
jgi:glucokinase